MTDSKRSSHLPNCTSALLMGESYALCGCPGIQLVRMVTGAMREADARYQADHPGDPSHQMLVAIELEPERTS